MVNRLSEMDRIESHVGLDAFVLRVVFVLKFLERCNSRSTPKRAVHIL